MEEVFVDQIVNDKYGMHGIIASKELALQSLQTIFGKKITTALTHQAKAVPEFYLIERFYQFAVFIHFQKKTGFSIKLSDFTKNSGTINAYLTNEASDWPKSERDKYASIVQGILSDKSEMAKISLVQ